MTSSSRKDGAVEGTRDRSEHGRVDGEADAIRRGRNVAAMTASLMEGIRAQISAWKKTNARDL